MTRLLILLITCVIVSTASAQSVVDSPSADRTKVRKAAANEVYVTQEKGNISAHLAEPASDVAKTVPEGQTTAAQNSQTNPTTCDPKNASSPACYTATQQGRAK